MNCRGGSRRKERKMSISAISSTPIQALQKPVAAQSTNAPASQTSVQNKAARDGDGDFDASPSSPVATISSAALSALNSLKPGG
jgi:hypothetical protein